ncbi:hypothetical protein [Apilactobacillus micheneri]|uniref:hypothetical protein n=1 Tax=Apilactobacillus micheneri TaxID=1899430 RepID=UPI0012FFE000|nr:hypothetical protein [Apilactobacillus micheneri]
MNNKIIDSFKAPSLLITLALSNVYGILTVAAILFGVLKRKKKNKTVNISKYNFSLFTFNKKAKILFKVILDYILGISFCIAISTNSIKNVFSNNVFSLCLYLFLIIYIFSSIYRMGITNRYEKIDNIPFKKFWFIIDKKEYKFDKNVDLFIAIPDNNLSIKQSQIYLFKKIKNYNSYEYVNSFDSYDSAKKCFNDSTK